MAHELQDRYSKLVDAKLRATLVKKDGVIFNNRYEGNPKAGKVKVPVRDTEVAVADYSKTDGAGATHGDTSYTNVTVDKDKAVNEIIDGFDAAAVPDNLVADRLDSAAYSMALQIERMPRPFWRLRQPHSVIPLPFPPKPSMAQSWMCALP